MIIIKGDDEAALVAKIESALSGEEIQIFQDDEEEFTLEQAVAFMAYNAVKMRQYLGRIERNTRKNEETLREQNRLFLPISQYYAILVSEVEAEDHAANFEARDLKNLLEDQRSTKQRLIDEGKIKEGK